MRQIVPCVETHTCGEPTRIVIGGLFHLPGATMVEKQAYVRDHLDSLRKALIREPRGHRGMFGAILTPPVTAGSGRSGARLRGVPAIRQHLAPALAGGRPAGARVAPTGPAAGDPPQAWQAATVVRLITDRCPDQLKLPFVLWTREAVRDLIARRFGVRLSVWTVGRYLRRWGFTPQKPLRRAYERDPAAVRRWLKKPYPAIRALARREQATIFWGDETGMRSDHQAGRS